ncbi:NAD(P)/FAD-dependent oxidoreductase [Aquincola sp. S2]|uniref:NAD(P)/FAD-dependent oxidoreductase n=2 Tax=Pseudaquabacterium terrae TaxID=2732868 RepID=A0ABX2EGS8_9BURK|nr:NAD(P)/FAD-dependent oxidoreductase [Aquabacterium terrae]
MEDVLVVGAGPAGAACALWLHQLGLKVMLLDAGRAIGGLQLRSPYTNRWIPSVQGKTGQEVARQLEEHVRSASVPCRLGFDVGAIRYRADHSGWEVSAAKESLRATYVVIATGSKPRCGGFMETEHVGIGPGISMERIDVHGKRVAILGGGDNAFDQAVFALRRGARNVDVYCRHTPRAQPILQREIPSHCVHVGPFDADQVRMTVNAAAYDVLGVQFGFEASIPAGIRLPLRDGYIVVDRHGAVPRFRGLFAAGEVTNFWHPCVTTALAHGVQVAKAIQNDHLAAASGAMPSFVERPAPRVARPRRGPGLRPQAAARMHQGGGAIARSLSDLSPHER